MNTEDMKALIGSLAIGTFFTLLGAALVIIVGSCL